MTTPTPREAELGIRYDADGQPITDTELYEWVWDDDDVWRRAEELHTAHPDIVRGVNRDQHSITLVLLLSHRKFLSILGWISYGQGRPPRIMPLAHYLKDYLDYNPRQSEDGE